MPSLPDMPEPQAETEDPTDAPSGPLAREALALGAFDHAVERLPGFRARAGQRDMAAHIAQTLCTVDWPPRPEKGEPVPTPQSGEPWASRRPTRPPSFHWPWPRASGS
ncbi:MAG: hypothetical protein MUF55_04455 [Hydrogenophaga sp.]|nr:hypothetical protein [Hydrogenophaga sp.]